MKHFLEKRNEEILQRDVKKKQMTKLDYNPADASEHKLEATRPHSHLQHALPSSVYNVRLVFETVSCNINQASLWIGCWGKSLADHRRILIGCTEVC